MAKLTKAGVEAGLRRHSGNMAAVAREVGVTRSAVCQFVDSHDLGHVIEEARAELVDEAENALLRKVKEGEGWAVCFALKTQGKRRGYIERQEVSGPDGAPLTLRIVTDDLEDEIGD